VNEWIDAVVAAGVTAAVVGPTLFALGRRKGRTEVEPRIATIVKTVEVPVEAPEPAEVLPPRPARERVPKAPTFDEAEVEAQPPTPARSAEQEAREWEMVRGPAEGVPSLAATPPEPEEIPDPEVEDAVEEVTEAWERWRDDQPGGTKLLTDRLDQARRRVERPSSTLTHAEPEALANGPGEPITKIEDPQPEPEVESSEPEVDPLPSPPVRVLRPTGSLIVEGQEAEDWLVERGAERMISATGPYGLMLSDVEGIVGMEFTDGVLNITFNADKPPARLSDAPRPAKQAPAPTPAPSGGSGKNPTDPGPFKKWNHPDVLGQ
jgi:hypothetical protein